MKKINIVFFGSSVFSIYSLIELYNNTDINIRYVVSKKDKKRGRGEHLHENIVVTKAKELDLPVIKVGSLLKNPDQLNTIPWNTIDYCIVVSFGYILPSDILCQKPGGFINLHSSLLPKYRGASPIQQSIINGDMTTGNTIIQLIESVDAGPILAVQKVSVKSTDTIEQIYPKLAQEGAKLLSATILNLHQGNVTPVKQNDSKATYTKLITKKDGYVTLHEKPINIYNKYRAYKLWPGIYTKIGDIEEYLKANFNIPNKNTLIKLKDLNLNSKGLLVINKVQLPNRPIIFFQDFINGYKQ